MPKDERERHLVFFADPEYFGGAEGYLAMLAEARPSDAWRLSALLPAGVGGDELGRLMEAAGVTVHRYRLRAPLHPALWWELTRLLRRVGGRILHLNLPWPYSARVSVPALLARLAGYRRVVTTEHLPMTPRAPKRMLLKMAMTLFIDAIVVHTDWNRRLLCHKHGMPFGKMHIIPNGSSEAPAMTSVERERLRSELGVAAGEVAIAVVGRLTERKGHRFLLDALARLNTRAWRLIVVGEGEAGEALQALAARLEITERVRFLGYRADARRIIHACDLLALSSLVETQPLVITEAMASGLPVVVTGIFGIPEIVANGETGRLVPPEEVPPLAAALEDLITDPDLRRRMGRAARKRYEEGFTLHHMATRTYSVLAGRGGTAA